MKRLSIVVVATWLTLLASAPGIRPRADAKSYAVHEDQSEFSIGADLISRDVVKKMFAADLNRAGYVVVEVGVFPAAGKEIDLYPADFRLWLGEGSPSLRPVDSDTISGILSGRHETQRAPSPHDVNTSVGVGIGHVSYPDPVTGRRTSGTITETEAGVGMGGPAPVPCRRYDCDSTAPAPAPQRPSIQDAHAIEQELWQKSLPDGKTSAAVAGYLYFPKPPSKAKNHAWELRYEPSSGMAAKLPLPVR